MGQQDLTVQELVDKLTKGTLRLPELQRGYVWRAQQVVNLFDSLYRGYPSGTILTWVTNQDAHSRELAIEQDDGNATTELLLDGQQRLTSLSAVLNNEPIKVKGRKRPINLWFNLDHLERVDQDSADEDDDEDVGADEDAADDDESTEEPGDALDQSTFAIAPPKLTSRSNWISVVDALKKDASTYDLLVDRGVDPADRDRYRQYEHRINRLRAIRDYKYRVDTIEQDKPYDEVAEIFVRINSGGTHLRGHDLALARITAMWPGSLKKFEKYDAECSERGFTFGFNVLLKTMLVFAIGPSRFRHVGEASQEKLKMGWAKAVEGLNYSMNFLESNLKVENSELLSSDYLAIALAAYGDAAEFLPSPEQTTALKRWALLANTKGRYSRGSTETMLDQDLAAIREGLGVERLTRNLEGQVGQLAVTATELASLSARSPHFKTMFMAFREAGAVDWRDGLVISLTHGGGKHRIERHHIFPQAVLTKAGHSKGKIDHGANLAFISARTNKWINKRPPSDYIPALIAESSEDDSEDHVTAELEKQCIPTDPELWEVDRYDDFLVRRRELISQRLAEFLGTADT